MKKDLTIQWTDTVYSGQYLLRYVYLMKYQWYPVKRIAPLFVQLLVHPKILF